MHEVDSHTIGKLDESSMWTHLAENIVLIVHIAMWALLCEFSIAFDTSIWRQFTSKRTSRNTDEEEHKELPLDDIASVTSSLPSYHSGTLPPYSNTPIQVNLPPLYEEDSDDESYRRHNLTYPIPAFLGQHRVIWNAFITISTEHADTNRNEAEPIVFDTNSEASSSRARSTRKNCIIQ